MHRLCYNFGANGSGGRLYMQKHARRFFVSGRVQGVGYRYFAMSTAEQLGISGYARNLRDGRVEVYAIGAPDQLVHFAAELRRGPRLANVDAIDEVEAEISSRFASGFTVNYEP